MDRRLPIVSIMFLSFHPKVRILSGLLSRSLTVSVIGVILSAAVNAPGSWHDSRVARGIFEQLRTLIPNNFSLVADTAFPRGTTAIEGKIRAPLKAGDKVTSNPMAQQHLMAKNQQLLSYRQTAEWGMRTMQGSFGRLRVPLRIADPDRRKCLLDMCVRLSNVRARCVGISQICAVYSHGPVLETPKKRIMNCVRCAGPCNIIFTLDDEHNTLLRVFERMNPFKQNWLISARIFAKIPYHHVFNSLRQCHISLIKVGRCAAPADLGPCHFAEITELPNMKTCDNRTHPSMKMNTFLSP